MVVRATGGHPLQIGRHRPLLEPLQTPPPHLAWLQAGHPQTTNNSDNQRHEDLQHQDLHVRVDVQLRQPLLARRVLVQQRSQHARGRHRIDDAEDADPHGQHLESLDAARANRLATLAEDGAEAGQQKRYSSHQVDESGHEHEAEERLQVLVTDIAAACNTEGCQCEKREKLTAMSLYRAAAVAAAVRDVCGWTAPLWTGFYGGDDDSSLRAPLPPHMSRGPTTVHIHQCDR